MWYFDNIYVQERELMKQFKIDGKTFVNFLMTLEENYLTDVPYHNSRHAADVAQSTHVLLNSPALEVIFLTVVGIIYSSLFQCDI